MLKRLLCRFRMKFFVAMLFFCDANMFSEFGITVYVRISSYYNVCIRAVRQANKIPAPSGTAEKNRLARPAHPHAKIFHFFLPALRAGLNPPYNKLERLQGGWYLKLPPPREARRLRVFSYNSGVYVSLGLHFVYI